MLFDPEQFAEQYNDSDFYDWLQSNNAQVEKYIRPCQDHPNLAGREQIAQAIAKTIKKEIT
jgi:lysophospholipase L1-like esterase